MQRSKKNYRRYLLVLSLLVSLIAGICTSAFADSYTYDIRGNQIPAPDAYELERTVYASELGSNLCQPYQVFFTATVKCM